MKTRYEVEDLKRQWIADGCWDIENTEGFEEYREELKKWRENYENTIQEKNHAELVKKAEQMKCSVETVSYIDGLVFRIKRLEAEVEKI